MPLLTLEFTMAIYTKFFLEWKPLEMGAKGSFKDKTFDELLRGKFDVPIVLSLATSGKVGLEAGIKAGAQGRLAVIVGGGEIIGSLRLEGETILKGTLNAAWEGEKGFKLKDGKGEADVQVSLFGSTYRTIVCEPRSAGQQRQSLGAHQENCRGPENSPV